jgi:flagellin-like hook-associated protein FlgL
MIINHNIPAISSYLNNSFATHANAKAMEKLSSGLRINRACDDPAGLDVSESLRKQIAGVNQATRNSQDAISLIQTAEGAFTEDQSILQRMRDLSVQAANDICTSTDRLVIQKEVDQLKEEINRIANTTSFNHMELLDGTAAALTSSDKLSTQVFIRDSLQVIGQSGEKTGSEGTYKIDIFATPPGLPRIQDTQIFKGINGQPALPATQLKDIDRFYDASGKFLLDSPQILTLVQGNGVQATVTLSGDDTIQDVQDKLNVAIAEGLGQGKYVSAADQNKFVSFDPAQGAIRIGSAVAGLDGEINIMSNVGILNALGLSDVQKSTESQFMVNVTDASDTSQVIAQNVLFTGNMMIGVVNPSADVQFDNNANILATYNPISNQIDLTADAGNQYTTYVHLVNRSLVFQTGADELQNISAAIGNMGSEALGIDKVVVSDKTLAGRAITTIDSAISRISSQVSKLGAIQNRLENTINNLSVTDVNLTDSESRIRDANIATAMMDSTRFNILAQVSTAMLAQDNKQAQTTIQLLNEL